MTAPCEKCRPYWDFRDDDDRAAIEALFAEACHAKHSREVAERGRESRAVRLARAVLENDLLDFDRNLFRDADAAVLAAEAAEKAVHARIDAALASRRSAA